MRQLIIIVSVFLFCLSLSSCIDEKQNIKPNDLKNELDSQIEDISQEKEIAAGDFGSDVDLAAVDMLPISRALVAKMIALGLNDRDTIESMDIEVNFNDLSEEWYLKYINAVVIQDIMKGAGESFSPMQPLTINQAQILLDQLDDNNKLKIKITDDNKNKPISYALWTDLFIKVLKNTSSSKTIEEQYGISEKSLIVLATPSNNSTLPSWTMISDKGNFEFSGLALDAYIDKRIKVLEKEGEIIAILEIEDTTPILTNCYITNITSSSVSVYAGGTGREYTCENIPEGATGNIADVELDNGKITNITLLTQSIRGTIKRTDANLIELMENGEITSDSDMKIYSIVDGNVKWKNIRDLTVGGDIAKFIIKENKICAAVIDKNSNTQNIRVALNTSTFESLLHPKVTVTCTTDYTVICNNIEKNYLKGELVQLSTDIENDYGNNRIYIKPSSNGKIEIKSISRNWSDSQSPQYRGIIEIKKQEGGYSIVNELGIEEYLYAVVPSEMPTSYGVEAAKVQAVTARSYAFNQINANRYHRYGANVDDSVQCQVYNNSPENQTSIEGVNSTKGQCLTYNNVVISANFFSTSAGATANSGDVWAGGELKSFPSQTAAYLKSQKQYKNADFGNLSIESNADKFFKETKIESYDSEFSWFRWNVTMSTDEITASINNNIKDRYNAAPKLIKTLQLSNTFRSRPINSIGNLIDIEVTKRGEGGNIMEMKITGTAAVVLVSTEYNIRTIIRPRKYTETSNDILLSRIDGTKVSNYSLMPSAFYTIDKKYDDNGKLSAVTFYGGGNGHGVGMSQNGVKGMIDNSYKYIDILKHYYNGVSVDTVW